MMKVVGLLLRFIVFSSAKVGQDAICHLVPRSIGIISKRLPFVDHLFDARGRIGGAAGGNQLVVGVEGFTADSNGELIAILTEGDVPYLPPHSGKRAVRVKEEGAEGGPVA